MEYTKKPFNQQRSLTLIFLLVLLIMMSGFSLVSAQAEATGLTAFHRSGQTFLTWPETAPDNPTITYQVYRHSAPIDAENLGAATMLAEVPQWSGAYWTERSRALDAWVVEGGYLSMRNYVINDLEPELPDGTGLFVWTTHEDGDFYYAVMSSDGTLFTTAAAIIERVGAPAPVLAWQSEDGLSRVYTQFMDYSAFNPTFDAPRPGNWMNLPEWETLQQARHQQYAYNYWVGLPSAENCEGSVPAQVPLILRIEGHGSRYGTPVAAEYWCAVMMWGDDPTQSWYFGFSATHDYASETPVITGPIVNYSEARLMRAVRDTIGLLDAPTIDTNRVYLYGHSMGGTGALMLGQRYPQVFAAIFASEPMMNYRAAQMWQEEMQGKWGAQDLNLPVEIQGLDAAHLTAYQGTGVWDWQNLGAQLSARRGDDMAFISLIHGTLDTVIDWETVVRPAYTNFYAGSRAFMAETRETEHGWTGFLDNPNWRFDRLTLRLDESLPGLSNASGNAPMPPVGVGSYNTSLEWSSSWNDFAGAPMDADQGWAVVLRSLAGDQTVDVTPRRLQRFVVAPGISYVWQNYRQSDNTVVQEGVVETDADGLITVEGFMVSEGGNRLVIRRQ